MEDKITTIRVRKSTIITLKKAYSGVSLEDAIQDLLSRKKALNDCEGQVKEQRKGIRRGLSRLKAVIKEILLAGAEKNNYLSGDVKDAVIEDLFFRKGD
jgi:hypothetical protein